MDSGVYQIYNPITNKRYIGSSIDIYRRIKEHRRNLKSNRHCNCHLQNAWNKYRNLLIFEILEFCEIEYIRECESMYMDYYKSYDRKFGYNFSIDTFGNATKLSEETKHKLSIARKGRIIPREVVEKVRIANTGKTRPTQSKNMRDRWDITKKYFGWNMLSEDAKLNLKNKLSISTTNRYKDFKNKTGNIFLKCTIFDEILYFHSYKEASRFLYIDKGSIRYAFKYSNGTVYKIHAKFEKIDIEEYIKNKVVGEK